MESFDEIAQRLYRERPLNSKDIPDKRYLLERRRFQTIDDLDWVVPTVIWFLVGVMFGAIFTIL